jgi:hypothetical protein
MLFGSIIINVAENVSRCCVDIFHAELWLTDHLYPGFPWWKVFKKSNIIRLRKPIMQKWIYGLWNWIKLILVISLPNPIMFGKTVYVLHFYEIDCRRPSWNFNFYPFSQLVSNLYQPLCQISIEPVNICDLYCEDKKISRCEIITTKPLYPQCTFIWGYN